MLYINKELCKGCYICVNICPKGVYTISETFNDKGIRNPVPDSGKCIKCNLCVLTCPDQVICIEDD